MNATRESGSHVIALAFGLLAVGVMAFAGYRVWQMQQPLVPPSITSTPSVSVPTTITSTTDLNSALNALNSESSQLSTNLNDSTLDADLNSML